MPAAAPNRNKHQVFWRERGIFLTPLLAMLWLANVLLLVVQDQLALEPPRPPTHAEVVAATPGARAHWRRVYSLLQQRLEPWQPRPPELGAVWSTRTGQICGLIDKWWTGVDHMTRFYTVGDRLFLRDDDLRLYVRNWSACMMDPWIVLHGGSEDEGLCASAAGRRNWGILCRSARRAGATKAPAPDVVNPSRRTAERKS
jgi:hypothetical protein